MGVPDWLTEFLTSAQNEDALARQSVTRWGGTACAADAVTTTVPSAAKIMVSTSTATPGSDRTGRQRRGRAKGMETPSDGSRSSGYLRFGHRYSESCGIRRGSPRPKTVLPAGPA